MWPGKKITGHTTRIPEGGGKPVTHLAAITLRQIGGYTFHMLSDYSLQMQKGGVDVSQWRRVYVDWPAGNTEDLPIKPNDALYIGTTAYPVRAVEPYPNKGMVVTVQVPYQST